MILPERFSTMSGRTARQEFTTPIRLISDGFAPRLGFGGQEWARWVRARPPRQSERPGRRTPRACGPPRRDICSRSRTSARSRSALPPACSISSLARSSSAWLRASSPTRAPACGEAHGQALTDSASRAGDQNALIWKLVGQVWFLRMRIGGFGKRATAWATGGGIEWVRRLLDPYGRRRRGPASPCALSLLRGPTRGFLYRGAKDNCHKVDSSPDVWLPDHFVAAGGCCQLVASGRDGKRAAA